MPFASSVASAARFTITPKGREDLVHAETCRCEIKLVGLLFECCHCGTVFGHLRDVGDRGGWSDRKPA